MTPEERSNQYIWWVLQRLKEYELTIPEGRFIAYDPVRVIAAGVPGGETEKNILEKLEQEGAIKILKKAGFDWRSAHPGNFEIQILHPKFDEVYQKYKEACDLNTHLEKFQETLVKGGSQTSKFSQLDSKKSEPEEKEIDEWLATKSGWSLQKIWQVVSALNSEWELRDQSTFNIPLDKFRRSRLTNSPDLEAILTTLHNKKIIRVERKIMETADDPFKPQGSLWVTIKEKPEIVLFGDTVIKLDTKLFLFLRNSLEKLVKGLDAKAYDDLDEIPQNSVVASIVDGFSSQNYPFVLMVLEKITSLTEFTPDNKISYQLQSPPGQLLIQERTLLKKLEGKGLFRHLGEDGIFGIAEIKDVDIEKIKQIIQELKTRQTITTLAQRKSQDLNQRYDELIKEIRGPKKPPVNLDERYEKVMEGAHFSKSKPKKTVAPDYKDHKILFLDKEIPVPPNTNQDFLCKVLFKDKTSLRKEWSWDEVVERWGEDSENMNWRVVYNAAREINNRVAVETSTKDFLVISKLTTSLNPKYLK